MTLKYDTDPYSSEGVHYEEALIAWINQRYARGDIDFMAMYRMGSHDASMLSNDVSKQGLKRVDVEAVREKLFDAAVGFLDSARIPFMQGVESSGTVHLPVVVSEEEL
jgi:hypothetical protein